MTGWNSFFLLIIVSWVGKLNGTPSKFSACRSVICSIDPDIDGLISKILVVTVTGAELESVICFEKIQHTKEKYCFCRMVSYQVSAVQTSTGIWWIVFRKKCMLKFFLYSQFYIYKDHSLNMDNLLKKSKMFFLFS